MREAHARRSAAVAERESEAQCSSGSSSDRRVAHVGGPNRAAGDEKPGTQVALRQTMLRPALAFVVVLVVCAQAAGCTQTIQYSQRLRIPLSQDPAVARRQSLCIAACEPLYFRDASRYSACLSSCPDAEVARDAACDQSEPANQVYCVEVAREREVADPEATQTALRTIGAILEVMTELSEAHDDCHGHHSSGSHKARRHKGSGGHAHRKPRTSTFSGVL